jgi:tetratricopeptide (TPR) repeat protein
MTIPRQEAHSDPIMNRTGSRARIIKGLALGILALTFIAGTSAHAAPMRQAPMDSAGSFAAGDYDRAIGFYQTLYEKDRANGKVVSGYAAMIEDVKRTADEARSTGRYEAAQSAYRALAANWEGYQALAPRLSFNKADLEASLKDCRLTASDLQFRQEIAAASYAKAIGAYQAVLKDYPADPSVKARYGNGIAELGEIGAKALAAKDFALAGRINGLLLKNFESFEKLTDTAIGSGLSREELEDAIRQCTATLVLDGLAEYQKGNVENAIDIWEGLLVFDPVNPEVRQAVETAKAQLSKIKGSGRGGGRSGRKAPGAR